MMLSRCCRSQCALSLTRSNSLLAEEKGVQTLFAMTKSLRLCETPSFFRDFLVFVPGLSGQIIARFS